MDSFDCHDAMLIVVVENQNKAVRKRVLKRRSETKSEENQMYSEEEASIGGKRNDSPLPMEGIETEPKCDDLRWLGTQAPLGLIGLPRSGATDRRNASARGIHDSVSLTHQIRKSCRE